MSRPSEKPSWAQGNPGVQVEPTAPQKFGGFAPNNRPSPQWVNWLFSNVSDWIDWLDSVTQASLIPNSDYDASVGTGGTFPDINSLMASGNIATIKKVLVTTPQTLTVTQVINQPDMEFVFKPNAWYAQGLALAKGISITAPRVTIKGGRWVSWPGAVAIQIEAGVKNCLLTQIRFNGVTTDVNDLGSNNVLSDLIDEA